jgi:hypothetical protein
VPLNANVPKMEALEHPLLASAFAVGAMPRASAATAAMVKVLAMPDFMIISFKWSRLAGPN